MKIDYFGLTFYCAFIFWLSSQQTLPAPMWFDQQDKLYHAAAYAIMGCLAWRCFRYTAKTPIILALFSVAFCSLYGASDEWHQSFVLGRNSSWEDWLADTIGAIIAVVMLSKVVAMVSSSSDHELAMANCAIDCANCSFSELHTSTPSTIKKI